jgi:cell wall-associated NlpC family hydrolase
MTWATKYIGLPFAEGGRGPDRYDCWGIVAAILRNECGIEVEPFAEIETFDGPAVEARVILEIARTDWIRVELNDVRVFDVALMWIYRRLLGKETARSLSHIGIVAAPGRLLHIDKTTRAVCPKFRQLGPAFQIDSFYRHRSLA